MHTSNPIRKTKIVATIGPASDSPATLEAMLQSGMSVARLNLSHGNLEEHKNRLDRIRAASDKLGVPVAIMLDTRGIEVRTGRIPAGSVELVSGAAFSLFTDGRPGDVNGTSVTYQRLAQEVALLALHPGVEFGLPPTGRGGGFQRGQRVDGQRRGDQSGAERGDAGAGHDQHPHEANECRQERPARHRLAQDQRGQKQRPDGRGEFQREKLCERDER